MYWPRRRLLALRCIWEWYGSSSLYPESLLKSPFFTFHSEQQIKYDDYLVPFTMYELGLIYKQRGDTDKAVELLEKIKYVVKPFSCHIVRFSNILKLMYVLCVRTGWTTRTTAWSLGSTSASMQHSTPWALSQTSLTPHVSKPKENSWSLELSTFMKLKPSNVH